MKKIAFALITLFSGIQVTAQELTERVFEGTINGKIPVKLTLVSDGEVAYGSVVYTKKGVPISVVGTLENGNFFLNELLPNGQVSGVYSGTTKADSMVGMWSAPKIDAKELPLDLRLLQQKSVKRPALKNVAGTYAYAFGKDGSVGNMRVAQPKPGQISVSFDNVTGAPARNQATISKTTLKLVNNQAVYSSSEFGKCKFTITFLENGARVSYTDEAYQCGFGNAATVTGNYIRTKTNGR